MCGKVANTHFSTMKFVPECYKTQEMCDKDFNKRFLGFFIFLITIKLTKCVTKFLLMILFLIRLSKSVMKLLMVVYSFINICP